MRHAHIAAWFGQAIAAATPADLERVLDAACCQLSEAEYTALQGELVSTANRAREDSSPLEEAIIQILSFTDGSRIRLVVEAPKGDIGLSLAHLSYYRHLFKPLEVIRGQDGER